jgi:hypothetical protein
VSLFYFFKEKKKKKKKKHIHTDKNKNSKNRIRMYIIIKEITVHLEKTDTFQRSLASERETPLAAKSFGKQIIGGGAISSGAYYAGHVFRLAVGDEA